MKTIGLLGGMSWESTELYYRAINEGVRARLGGHHSAQIAMVSVDFQAIETLQHAGDWDGAAALLARAAEGVEAAGADFVLICTNTMHRVAAEVQAAINVPLLHLADATGARIAAAGLTTVGLLGTRFTMEQDFYRSVLEERYGLKVLIPDETDRECVHRIIYEELVHGIIKEDSRAEYLRIIDALERQGAEAVIEGCTEIVLLVGPQHTDVRLFDTTAIHAEEAVALALGVRQTPSA